MLLDHYKILMVALGDVEWTFACKYGALREVSRALARQSCKFARNFSSRWSWFVILAAYVCALACNNKAWSRQYLLLRICSFLQAVCHVDESLSMGCAAKFLPRRVKYLIWAALCCLVSVWSLLLAMPLVSDSFLLFHFIDWVEFVGEHFFASHYSWELN